MKKFGFILLALVLSANFAMAQSGKKNGKVPNPVFDKTVFDFGKINESAGTATCDFTFTNKGTAPFIIQRVQASCGCTTPDYTNEPVLPGKTGKIKVTYSTTGRPGSFDKKVTVFSNVPDEVYVLTIKGEVLKK